MSLVKSTTEYLVHLLNILAGAVYGGIYEPAILMPMNMDFGDVLA